MPETVYIASFRFALLILLGVATCICRAQCPTLQTRVYARTEQINNGAGTSVTNDANAADGDITTYSILNRPLGLGNLITVTQFLKFPATVSAGTPVTIKTRFPSSLLSLLAGVEIQPFTNLHQVITAWVATPAGQATTDASLLGVLNGAGDMEITITPQQTNGTTVNYDGVWIKLSGVALGQSLNIFDAYYLQNASGSVSCNSAVDVLSGVRAGTVVGGIANATGSVTNPYNAIDNDATPSTYAEMNLGAQVVSQVFHTTIFSTVSQPGDFIRMILQNPGGGLLSLAALSGFSIQLYNKSTPVGAAIGSGSGLLSLSLFPGSTDKYQLDIAPASTTPFDRVEIQMGGVLGASLTYGLRIYDVKRLIGAPTTNINGAASTAVAVCSGNGATLTVNNIQSCTTYKWYDAASGGTLLQTGTSYTPAVASLTSGLHQYYVEASHSGCTDASTRTIDSITVNPLPVISTVSNPSLCTGLNTTAIGYTATNSPSTYSLTWDATALAAGFANVTNATLPLAGSDISIAVPPGAAAAVYNGNLTVKNNNGCVSTAKPVTVTVRARSSQPILSLVP